MVIYTVVCARKVLVGVVCLVSFELDGIKQKIFTSPCGLARYDVSLDGRKITSPESARSDDAKKFFYKSSRLGRWFQNSRSQHIAKHRKTITNEKFFRCEQSNILNKYFRL